MDKSSSFYGKCKGSNILNNDIQEMIWTVTVDKGIFETEFSKFVLGQKNRGIV